MLGGARGRGAIALIAAFASSVMMALPDAVPAAERAANVRVGAGAGAGTMEGAVIGLSKQPPAQCAALATRAADENVPNALAGYRPRISGTSSLTEQYIDVLAKATTAGGAAVYSQSQSAAALSSHGLTATRTLFNGFQTANRTRQAEGQVFSAREILRTTEQITLLNAATAYMNCCRRRPSSSFNAAT